MMKIDKNKFLMVIERPTGTVLINLASKCKFNFFLKMKKKKMNRDAIE